MKLYLKLWLAMAIPYGLLMAIFMTDPAVGALTGALFGTIMSLIFGTLQHQSFRGKKADAERSVKQSRNIELDLPIDEAFNLCLEAYTQLRRAVIRKIDRESHTIEIRTGINWLTYGEIITLHLSPIDLHTTEVVVNSRPRIKSVMIDYGRNLQNVNLIMLHLREQIASDHLALEEDHTEVGYTLETEDALNSVSYSR